MCGGGGAGGGEAEAGGFGTIASALAAPSQQYGTVGGRRVAVPGAEEDIPGITELAYGLMREGVTLPQQNVAGFSADQLGAFDLARGGIGSFQPYLGQATGLTQYGVGALDQARLGTVGLAGNIPGQVSSGQSSLLGAENIALGATGLGVGQLGQAGRATQNLAGQIPGVVSPAVADIARSGQAGVQGLEDARRATGYLTRDILQSQQAGQAAIASGQAGVRRAGQAGVQGLGQSEAATRQISGQIPGQVSPGQAALAASGQMAGGVAAGGIGALFGTGAGFDPRDVRPFMSEYEDAAVQQALADIRREGEIAGTGVRAQAVGAGAFGGSRQAVAEQELQRNIMEQQGRTAAQMRAAGFESAAQRSQQAFEQALQRQQQAASLGSQIGFQGAQALGETGMQQSQLGLSGLMAQQQAAQQAGSLAQAAAQLGMSEAQLRAQLGMEASGLARGTAESALGAEAQRATLAQQAAQLGMSEAQLRAQLGMSGIQAGLGAQQQAAGIAGQQAGLGLSGAQAAGNLGLQSSQLGLSGIQAGLGAQQQAAGLGQGIAGLGQQFAGLGAQQQQQQLQDINTMLTTGGAQQRLNQAQLDTAYQNQYAQTMQPYQQLAFASDIITGAPSGQSSVMSQPGPSIASQAIGLGLAVPALYQGFQGMTQP